MLIDTHVHLNAEQYVDDLDEVIERARENGIEKMVVIGCDRPTIERTMELIDEHEDIYGVIGWHPVDAIDCTDEDLEWIEQLSKHEKIVGIGEMGLDYHWDKSPKDVQKDLFKKQIELAKRVNLPIIIHNREATEDCVAILKEMHAEKIGGIMHAFSGDESVADEIIDMNFYVSLGGPVTFKNAQLPKDIAVHVPIDRLLVETDAPYLTPHPYRGKRNEPAYVKLVAEKIAELRQISYEELAQTTSENAKRLFKI
ncbi:TatD family hydrolase [Jeotgalicoccus meleagridis]|uniref:Putative deoxyribonuclease YcfH n=1 Tax=Jeotgalicoccus meleagridis TaxID=2759181 RepID=A0A6V7RAT2_9STAP|nr:TatD family hydrolase [Jeotgalicoccus meleagridis]CAD2074653.1 putative deoxyribonuclease YcfH [Jeotgalicoccus meleagridis]HIW37760.1 TatD family hydrolase [Candidatus Jeotgalicoccus stercoravium]